MLYIASFEALSACCHWCYSGFGFHLALPPERPSRHTEICIYLEAQAPKVRRTTIVFARILLIIFSSASPYIFTSSPCSWSLAGMFTIALWWWQACNWHCMWCYSATCKIWTLKNDGLSRTSQMFTQFSPHLAKKEILISEKMSTGQYFTFRQNILVI